ncbi:MAG: hypothetical protein Q9218_005938 [Villophora microphyllina]
MPFRKAHLGDLPIITSIFAAAFYGEEMIGLLLHPYRHPYLSDYMRYWNHKVVEWYWNYSHQLVVTYTHTPAGDETVTGVADWTRYGEDWEHYWGVWGTWDPRNLITKAILLYHRILLFWRPNRAADPAMHKTVTTALSHTKHLWSGKRSTGWYLNFIGVDPEYQNQGYGRALTVWGIEQAKQENVAASVISGTEKDRFYYLCGFEVIVGHVTDGEGNPLKDKVEGGSILFRDRK